MIYHDVVIHLIVLVVLVASVASFARLAVDDEITAPFRVKVEKRYGEWGFWTRLIQCTRCVSVWIAPMHVVPVLACYTLLGLIPWWISLLSAIPASMGVAYLAFRFVRSE